MNYTQLANAVRFLSIDAVENAKSGHPGMPMGMADVATVLFNDFLVFNPDDSAWPNRDRFVLSAGHGSMLLYSLLFLCGYPGITLETLKNFRQLGSPAAGHPEFGHLPGIETTTGPLGQGLATAVGMALGEQLLQARVGNIINHYTYVMASDGDLMEGISHEAMSLAGHLKLSKLIVLFDDNQITIDGPTSLSTSDNHDLRFQAYGWNVLSIDGHDFKAIQSAIQSAKLSDKPTIIRCKTIIGKGSPNKCGKSSAHGSPLGHDEVQLTREQLKWPYPAFEVPAEILNSWRECGKRHQTNYNQWHEQFNALSAEHKKLIASSLNFSWKDDLKKLKTQFAQEKPQKGTRLLSQEVLNTIAPLEPKMIGGSADLTPSNNTLAKQQSVIQANNFEGSYIHYGIREHGMAACMNGLSLYGFIPYGGTFLAFTDYLKPALRLSALMKQGVIYVMTHDSIGLGEDGPTHQPIEHLASLRATPNVLVFRPCDAIEVTECWDIALHHLTGPSVLVLSRQNIIHARDEQTTQDNLTHKGGYVLRQSRFEPQVTLIATGSEVGLALQAFDYFESQNIGIRVVSMPCTQLFDQQSSDYQQTVLGNHPRIVIEAAHSFGWHKYIQNQGCFIGIDTFGMSAPAQDIYNHFNITLDHIIQKVKEYIHS